MKTESTNPANLFHLTFVKEGISWYIDLPLWTGDKADLQMVAGADTFLDFLSNNGDRVEMMASKNGEGDYSGILKKVNDRPVGGGADYELIEYQNVTFPNGGHPMWLCDVTKFVFGQLPDTIYFKN